MIDARPDPLRASPAFVRLWMMAHPGIPEEIARIMVESEARQAVVSAMCRDAVREIDDAQSLRRRRAEDEARNQTNPLGWLWRNLFG